MVSFYVKPSRVWNQHNLFYDIKNQLSNKMVDLPSKTIGSLR